MKSAVNLDTHSVTDIEFQPASLDIWDAKYRLAAKDGAKIDETIDDTYKRVAQALADVEVQTDDVAAAELVSRYWLEIVALLAWFVGAGWLALRATRQALARGC